MPDASLFRKVHYKDDRLHCIENFGEALLHPEYETFMGWCLFLYADHRQVFTEDSLWCTLVNRECPRNGSFHPDDIVRTPYMETTRPGHYCSQIVSELDRRPGYSIFMEAFKR